MSQDSNDERLISDYGKVIPLVSPHLQLVEGNWYHFEQDGAASKVLLQSPDGLFATGTFTLEALRELGWTATPVVIFKVDTEHVR